MSEQQKIELTPELATLVSNRHKNWPEGSERSTVPAFEHTLPSEPVRAPKSAKDQENNFG